MHKIWSSMIIISSYLIDAAEEKVLPIRQLLQESLAVQKTVGKEALKEHKLYLTVPTILREFKDVDSFAYHPSGDYAVMSFCRANNIQVRNLETEQPIAQLEGHEESVGAVAFNAQGTQLASGSDDGVIYLWDVRTWKQFAQLKNNADGYASHMISELCYNPTNDAQLLSKKDFYPITIWDTEQRKEIGRKEGCCFAYNTEGTQCAIGNNNRIELYDTTTWEVIRTIDLCGEPSSILFHPTNGRLTASSSHGMALEKINKTFECIKFPRKGTCPKLAYDTKGNRLVVGDERSIYIYDTSNQEKLIDDPTNTKMLWMNDDRMDLTYSVVCHPGNKQFAILFKNRERLRKPIGCNTLQIWDIPHYKDVVSPLSLAQALYVARELTIKKRMFEERNKESQKMYDSLPANIQRVLEY